MFLTRFMINPARRGAQKLLGSAHAMHAAVLSSFPAATDQARSQGGMRVLWRVDRGPSANVHLYISSPQQPDLTHLVEQAGWPTTETWQTRDYTSLLDRLESGQSWGFRLKANPVHAVRIGSGQRTKRLGHVTASQQLNWLLERATPHGFALAKNADGDLAVGIQERDVMRFSRNGKTVTLSTATYEGALVVTDPQSLRMALTGGIGRAKGYGCGMLTLAPIP